MQLIESQEDSDNTKVKNYVVNQGHPMFKTLRGIIMQFVGLDQIVDQIIKKLGNLDLTLFTHIQLKQEYLEELLALLRLPPPNACILFMDICCMGTLARAKLG